MTYGPILVPVDFSDGSECALVWAAQLAARLSQKLCVLHVVHDPEEEPGFYRGEGDDGPRTLEDKARAMLDAYLEDAKQRLPLLDRLDPAVEIVVGLPAQRILEVAERVASEHIVMGSQGRTGLAHLLLGSVAQRVVQLAPMPVTIVKLAAPRAED